MYKKNKSECINEPYCMIHFFELLEFALAMDQDTNATPPRQGQPRHQHRSDAAFSWLEKPLKNTATLIITTRYYKYVY